MKEKEIIKKDARPIWIYLAIFLGVPMIAGMILGIVTKGGVTEISNEMLCIINIVTYLLAAIIFIILYNQKLKKDLKKLTKKNIIFILVSSIILIVLNEAISVLLSSLKVDMNNQESIIEMLKVYKYPMIIVTVFLGPLVEEIVYRYSISTIIKNKIVFVIISSIVFGLAHGIGIATLLYIFIGAILGFIYLKCDENIVSSIMAHIINNAFSIIMILISL